MADQLVRSLLIPPFSLQKPKGDDKLIHVGRVGTGFSHKLAEDLFRRLDPMRIRRRQCKPARARQSAPFVNLLHPASMPLGDLRHHSVPKKALDGGASLGAHPASAAAKPA